MSYSQSQYSKNTDNGSQNRKYGDLPPIDQRKSSNMIDYSQQRPLSGYSEGGFVGGEKTYGSTGYSDNTVGTPQINLDTQDGQPLQLIKADPRTGKFYLNDDVVEELMSYEGNISFVTVAGRYRTGKSFLLNKLLNLKGEGFVVDPTTDACTQGIWIWSKPIYNERDSLKIFFLDTEGTSSVEKSATHDAKTFALSLLMSSYFIYNSVGNIDENSINDLSLTTQLSKNIVVSTDKNSEHVLSFYTPKFLWALRDFTLELQDSKGRSINSNQYLENALTDQSTYTKITDNNRKIRQALLNYFKDRECLTFVRPTNEEKDLRKLNTLPNNQIRSEFLKQINALRDKILTKVTAKQLKGVNLNMRMYVAMLQKYVEAINEGSVPNISTAWDYLVENECKEAFEQSIELYEIALKQIFFSEEKAKSTEELYNILKNIRDSTLEKYNKITAAIERNDVTQDYKNQLKDYIDKKEQAVVSINEEINQANNEDLLKHLSQVIKDNITSGVYGPKNIQDFYDDFEQFLTGYDVEGEGFNKCSILVNFLKNFQGEAIATLILSLNKALQKDIKTHEFDKARYNENEKNMKMNLDVLKEKEQNATEQLQTLKQEKAELGQKTTKLSEQLQKLKEAEEEKLEKERERNKQEVVILREKVKEYEHLVQQNNTLKAQIKTKKNVCGPCNIF